LVLNAINIDELLNTIDDEWALQITAIIAEATLKTQSSTKRQQKSTNSSN
jgi:hypothetical protein